MNTVSVLYCLKRNQPGVPKDKMYLCNKYRAHIGMSNGGADLPTLQWGSKEEAAKYDEVYADFLITFAGAFFNYTLEKEEWRLNNDINSTRCLW